MNIFKLAIKNTFEKKLNLALTLGLLVVSFMAWLLSVNVDKSLQAQLQKNVSGIDMVLGAKGSPLQLMLSAVLFSDNPTGNISIKDYEKIAKNPFLENAIPIALGDNIKGYPLVGSNEKLIAHYNAKTTNGEIKIDEHFVVVGALAAKRLKLKVGDELEATHGSAEGKSHAHHHLKVAAILEANNSVLDKLIVCSIEAVHNNHSEVAGADEQITAAWLKFKSPMAMMQLPRIINKNTSMQAALPSIEMNRLLRLTGGGVSLIKVFSGIFLFLALYSILVHVYNSVKNHLPDLALMRLYGYSMGKLFALLLFETFIITVLGACLSIGLSKLLFVLANAFIQTSIQMPVLQVSPFTQADIFVLCASVAIGLLASILPLFTLAKSDLIRFLK